MKVAVIGAGYVGLTTGVALAYLGHDVFEVDKDPSKIDRMKEGHSPIHEPGLEEMMALASAHLTYTTDTRAVVADADLIMIAVGTPPKANGEADIQYVEQAAAEVAEGLVSGRSYTIVVKSTVPIGTNRRVALVVRRVLSAREVDATVHFASNPEFLREGNALFDTLYPDRIVVGSKTPDGAELLRRLYRPILEQTFPEPEGLPRPASYALPPFVTTDRTSAELIKYSANAFLAMKISFINEIAGLCERVGGDVVEVARGIGLDPRIGTRFLGAGLGWGGSCFPKDTAALIAVGQEYGYELPLVQASREVNERQRHAVVERLQSVLKVLRGRSIAILGLAFKPNTDDVRDSPAIEIIRILNERGAHVRAHDPIAAPAARSVLADLADVEIASDPYHAVEGCDAAILCTEWSSYRKLDWDRLGGLMSKAILIDGRNALDPERLTAAGFTYMGVGR